MKVLVALPDNNTRVYLEGLNGYRSEKCEPKITDDQHLAVFELSLINFYDCGLIRVVNKLTVSGRDELNSSCMYLVILINFSTSFCASAVACCLL